MCHDDSESESDSESEFLAESPSGIRLGVVAEPESDSTRQTWSRPASRLWARLGVNLNCEVNYGIETASLGAPMASSAVTRS